MSDEKEELTLGNYLIKPEKYKCLKCGYSGTAAMYISVENEPVDVFCVKCIARLYEKEFGKMVKVDEGSQ